MATKDTNQINNRKDFDQKREELKLKIERSKTTAFTFYAVTVTLIAATASTYSTAYYEVSNRLFVPTLLVAIMAIWSDRRYRSLEKETVKLYDKINLKN